MRILQYLGLTSNMGKKGKSNKVKLTFLGISPYTYCNNSWPARFYYIINSMQWFSLVEKTDLYQIEITSPHPSKEK